MTGFCIQHQGRASSKSRAWRWFLAGLMVYALGGVAAADTINFSGVINQSSQDGTGPAANNPDLNNIQDGESYTVTLDFPGSITSAGTFPLSGASLLFHDSSASASETSFDSVSLSVLTDGSFFDIGLMACLTTGSGCATGNQLTANFQISAKLLNSANVPAVGLDQPHPLDLLEDDGTTDIHGSITVYSYSPPGGTNVVPEPSSLLPVCMAAGCAAGLFLNREPRRKRKNHPRNN